MKQRLREAALDSHPVYQLLTRWLERHPALRTIATFAALPGEIDLSSLTASHPEIHWAFPRVSGETLVFHRVKNQAELLPGAFHILEPSPTLPETEISAIDAFICPGLAFDARGGRLGRGKGFYDRILKNARADAQKIGVCHALQRVPDVFSEAHDIRMDQIISG